MSKSLFNWAVTNQYGTDYPYSSRKSDIARWVLRWVYAERYYYYVQANATQRYRDRIWGLESDNDMFKRRLDSMYKICAEMDGTGKSYTYERLMRQVHGTPSPTAKGASL